MGLKRYISKVRKAVTRTVKKIGQAVESLNEHGWNTIESIGQHAWNDIQAYNPGALLVKGTRELRDALIPEVNVNIPPESPEQPLPAPEASMEMLDLSLTKKKGKGATGRSSLKINKAAPARLVGINVPR
jgi:hypothetical protein